MHSSYAFYISLLAYATPILAEIAPNTACVVSPAVHMISARGTNESPTDHGGAGAMYTAIATVIARLPGSNYEGVQYPASFMQPLSNNQGNGNMTLQVTNYAQRCPNSKIVLMGWSQGAQIVGDVMSGGGTGTPYNPFVTQSPGGATDATPPLDASIASKVVALILFGDPTRVRNSAYDKDNTGCSVSAPYARTGSVNTKWQSYASKIAEYCDQWDYICCSSANILTFWTHGDYLGAFGGSAKDYIKNGIADFIAARSA